MNESSIYEDLQDINTLKRFMQTQLEDYNETPGLVPMNLVLFQDAIEHSIYPQHPRPQCRAEFWWFVCIRNTDAVYIGCMLAPTNKDYVQ